MQRPDEIDRCCRRFALLPWHRSSVVSAHGVFVFCIAPGWVETEMAAAHLRGEAGAAILAQHPLGRVMTPDEVARAATFCALDAPAAMTGAILDVNGASYLRT